MSDSIQFIPKQMKPLDVIRFAEVIADMRESERSILLEAFQIALKPMYMVTLPHTTPQD